MKCAVFGAGMVGKALVHDLSRQDEIDEVIVVDCELDRARAVAETYGHGKTKAQALDVTDGAAVEATLEGVAAAVGAVSYRCNEGLTRAAIAKGVHFVDLGGNNDVVARQFALSDAAKEADVAIVPDCGIAPGLVSILAARCLELEPEATDLCLRVGGLPLEPVPPFDYQVVFSVEGLVNEYKEPTVCIRDGKEVTVPSLADLETIEFPAPFGTLEAFNTSGGASTLPKTFKGKVENLDYKTIRYPGHCHLIRGLFALGLADEAAVEVDGVSVVPRRLLERQIAERLSFDGPDVILSLVSARSPQGRTVQFRIADRADEKTGLSAMARCTAFPAAAIAHMLATGVIKDRGTLYQELSVPAAAMVEAVRARGIEVVEERG